MPGWVIILFIVIIFASIVTCALYLLKAFRVEEMKQDIKNRANNILRNEYDLRQLLSYLEHDEYKDILDEKITKIHNNALAIKRTLKDNR